MILITGGNGALGRNLCQSWNSRKMKYLKLPRSALHSMNMGELSQLVSIHNVRVIVHTAAVVPSPPDVLDNLENAALTRSFDEKLSKVATENNCYTVYFSGCSLYNNYDYTLKSESSPLNIDLRSPYLKAKLWGENLFKLNNPGLIFRVSAPISTFMSKATALKTFIRQLNSTNEITLWGSGLKEQDYLHVSDITNAVNLGIQNLPCDIFNLCSSQPITMLDLARQLIQIKGSGKIVFSDWRENLQTARYSNVKITKELGWSPKITLLDSLTEVVSDAN